MGALGSATVSIRACVTSTSSSSRPPGRPARLRPLAPERLDHMAVMASAGAVGAASCRNGASSTLEPMPSDSKPVQFIDETCHPVGVFLQLGELGCELV